MIYGSHWVEVLDPAWLNSPTMLNSMRRRAERDVTFRNGRLLIGPERFLAVGPLGVGYLVYPVAVQP